MVAARGSGLRWAAAGAALLGCVKPNPAFDEASFGEAATGATAGTEGGPTTGGPTTGGPTTGAPDTSGTTEPGTSAVTSSTSAATTEDVPPDMPSETGTSTGGEPGSCWDLGLDAWTLEPLALAPPGGSPTLSPDALTLRWRAFSGPEIHVFEAARADLDAAFPAGASTWPSSTYEADHPVVVAATQELFFHGSGGDIYLVPRDGDGWGEPDVAGGVTAFGPKRESHPNPTVDGARLLFQRDDGPPFGQFEASYNFYQIARDPRTQAKFPDNPPIAVTPGDPGLGLVVCPALAPDGLHLLFGGFDSEGGGLGDPNDGRAGVWYARRDDVDEPAWHGVTRSAQLREAGWVTCPVSVSADGCHLTLERFVVGQPKYELRIARRG